MRRRLTIILFSFFACFTLTAQDATTIDIAYEEMISSLLDFSVPMVTIEDYKSIKDQVVLLDAREPKEYQVSHIPGALNIGYDHLNEEILKGLDSDDTIIIYCSVGYRSEKMGQRLVAKGFSKVYNLYGSVFQWVNQGNDLENLQDQSTKKIHTYNRSWSKWMVNPDFEKVY